jgi:hypothetical protein
LVERWGKRIPTKGIQFLSTILRAAKGITGVELLPALSGEFFIGDYCSFP